MYKLTLYDCSVLIALLNSRIDYLKEQKYFKTMNEEEINELEEIRGKIKAIEYKDLDNINF